MIKIALIIDEEKAKKEIKNNLSKINDTTISIIQNEFNDEINNYQDIDLIIFNASIETIDNKISYIKKINSKYPSIKFFILSKQIDSDLINKIKENNISEFILLPIMPNIFNALIKKYFNKKNSKSRVFHFFSNKGGIGKTTTLMNIAYEIQQLTNKRTCILDLNFSSESAKEFLNLNTNFYIDDILKTNNNQDIISKFTKYKDSNLFFINTKNNYNYKKYEPKTIDKLISKLNHIFDYILIDSTSIIDETTSSIFNNSDLIIFFTIYNKLAIDNCDKCYEIFDKLGYSNDKIKLLINRFIQSEENSIDNIENNLKRKISFTIPNNYLTLIDAINQNSLIAELNPNSNIRKAYLNVAKELINQDYTILDKNKKSNHGIFDLLRRIGE